MSQFHIPEALGHGLTNKPRSITDDLDLPDNGNSGHLTPTKDASSLAIFLALEAHKRGETPHSVEYLDFAELANLLFSVVEVSGLFDLALSECAKDIKGGTNDLLLDK